MYHPIIKRMLDIILSGIALVLLAIPMLLIALAIKIDDGGPILFKQERVGQKKGGKSSLFTLWKFRSMKLSTPHDVPTDRLQSPDQHITAVGRFIRRTSLDELPQLFQVLSSKMSLVGPRPVLPAQKELLALREQCGADRLKPGITGLAQVNGRDLLSDRDKAGFDGEYAAAIRNGKGLQTDLKCLIKTVRTVLTAEGFSEGTDMPQSSVSDYPISVSVIIPAYCCENTIRQTIDSVLAQTYPDWEMIVANDHSTDGTRQIVEQYASVDPRIHLLDLPQNVGSAMARNAAISQARGRYLAFLDSDDLWKPEKLQKQIAFMEQTRCCLSFTAYEVFKDSHRRRRVFRAPAHLTYRQYLGNTAIGCLTVMVDRASIPDFHMIRGELEDSATWMHYLRQGITAYGLNEPLACYRVHPGSKSANKIQNARRYYRCLKTQEDLRLPSRLYYQLSYACHAAYKRLFSPSVSPAPAVPLIQVLVATMGQTDHQLLAKMNIQTTAIIGNQCDRNEVENFVHRGAPIKWLSFAERGVGLNRNNTLMRADGDIVMFADDDMVFVDGYEALVSAAFQRLPKADVILFDLQYPDDRHRPIRKIRRLSALGCMGYGTPHISARLHSLHAKGLSFHLYFGGGAKFSHGEDSLFLMDCLRQGLRIYAYPAVIARLEDRPSTWFRGYSDRYFFDKGVLIRQLFPRMGIFYGAAHCFRQRKAHASYGSFRAFRQICKGLRHDPVSHSSARTFIPVQEELI